MEGQVFKMITAELEDLPEDVSLMTEEDKISVLCALINTIKLYRERRPVMQVMNWIKVTPETMPPDMKEVFVIIEYDNGERCAFPNYRYNPECGWEWLYEAGTDYWVSDNSKITNWMPYPDPAED